MNRSVACCLMALGVVLVAGAYTPPPIEFDTTAETDRGAMYLGNGEIGSLAWVSKDGTLHTVLQRSDNWNEGGQHVKIGGLDYVTGRPVDAGSFHQVVSLADGWFEASWKSAGEPVRAHYRLQEGVDFAVCEVVGGRDVKSQMVNPRIYPKGFRTMSIHELENRFVEGRGAPKEVSTFDISSDVVVPDGWCHVNATKTVETMLKWYDYWQATADCGARDFLRDRAFGCLTRRAAEGARTLFISAVTCWHPCASVADWTQRTRALLDSKGWSLAEESARRAAHAAAWHAFWDRSHIEVTPRAGVKYGCIKPRAFNPKLPVTIGAGSANDLRWQGELKDAALEASGKTCYQSAQPKVGERVTACSPKDLEKGYAFSCRFKFVNPKAYQRLFDCISPGGSDGTLVDVCGGRLRVIFGSQVRTCAAPVRVGKEETIRVFVTPAGGISVTRNGTTELLSSGNTLADECRAVSAAWATQRYLARCVGRGTLPIRFNGSLFTASQHGRMDARTWGHGFWWQNTRLAYYPMFAAGDWEMTEPLFRMYVDSLLEFNRKRTRKYLNHGGAYFPECIQPWGDHFIGTYGTECPWPERKDKLQSAPWHKYEWVGQLELSFMLLERLAFTEDVAWFKAKALPAIREYVTHFDQHYAKNAAGTYVMFPSQAVETYQLCTNAMPEIAGLHAVVARLLALEQGILTDADRTFFASVQKALPPLPTRALKNGEKVFAPAQKFGRAGNCETPELYCVYPFRLCSFEKANAEQGRKTYAVRPFRLFHGWAQDELFAANLGMAEEARAHFVNRVLTHSNRGYRWPACWGPNFNTCPDGDEGSNIQNIPQQMLMQYEGRKIFLLPAWPKDWNCRFKLHAPYNTTLEGCVENGRLKDLVVTPASRRADIEVMADFNQKVK